jgi:succinyl-diaminopimelate desuccinylase
LKLRAQSEGLKRQALRWLDADGPALVEFLAAFVRKASPNPPGNTRAAADHVAGFLASRGLPFSVVAPQAESPNIGGIFDCAAPGRHLALNGHIDVYPVTDAAGWARAPFSGDIAEGRVHRRGAADMKCGLTASLVAYAYLHRLRGALGRRVSLSAVSDEEAGGLWGTGYLFAHHPELIGDCCLNGEPGSPHLVRVGEKGPLWLRFTVNAAPGHGGYPIPGTGAIASAARLILDLERVTRLPPATPPALKAALEGARAAMERGLGAGAVETVQAVTLNVGKIRGGDKISLRATECVFDADIRLPVGIEKAAVMAEIEPVLARHPNARMEELIYAAPNVSDPVHVLTIPPPQDRAHVAQRTFGPRDVRVRLFQHQAHGGDGLSRRADAVGRALLHRGRHLCRRRRPSPGERCGTPSGCDGRRAHARARRGVLCGAQSRRRRGDDDGARSPGSHGDHAFPPPHGARERARAAHRGAAHQPGAARLALIRLIGGARLSGPR